MLRHLLWIPTVQAKARLSLPILGHPALQFQLRWLHRNGVTEFFIWDGSRTPGSEVEVLKLAIDDDSLSLSTIEELWSHGGRLEAEELTGHGFLSDLSQVTDLGLTQVWTNHLEQGSALTQMCSGPNSDVVMLCGDLALLRGLTEPCPANTLEQLAEFFGQQGIKVDLQDVSGIYHQGFDQPECLLDLHRDLLREGDIANLPPVNDRGIWQGEGCFVHPETDLVPPIWLGARVTIAREARLYGPVVVGDKVSIGEGAFLSDCVISSNTVISAGSLIQGCVLPIPFASSGGFLDQDAPGA